MEADFHPDEAGKIVEQLQKLSVGDEVTIEAVYGYENRAQIFQINGDKGTALFDDPAKDESRVIDLENGRIAKIPDHPDGQYQWKQISEIEFHGPLTFAE